MQGFDTNRFLRELRIFFIEIATLRVLLYLDLPLLQLAQPTDDSRIVLPVPKEKSQYYSTIDGQVRMADWLKGVLAEKNGATKTAVRRYAHGCSTSCAQNTAELPLEDEVRPLSHEVG